VEALEQGKDGGRTQRRATPRQHLMRHVLLGVGRFPPGQRRLRGTAPVDRPDPELAKAQLRMAVERLSALAGTLSPEQQERCFVPHPVIGDLNFPEWVRYLYIQNRHDAQLMGVRMRWLRRRPAPGRGGRKG